MVVIQRSGPSVIGYPPLGPSRDKSANAWTGAMAPVVWVSPGQANPGRGRRQ